MTLPSKKIVPTLAASILAIGVIAVVWLYNPQPSTATSQQSASVLTAVSPVSDDLLFATSSGESALTGTTSPSQAALAIGIAGAATTSEAFTTTQKLAQDLFSQYMAEQQGGNSNSSLTDDQENQIIQSTLLNDTPTLQFQTYNQTDLIVSPDVSAVAMKNYGNAVATVFYDNGISLQDNELLILDETLNNSDPGELKKIDLAISAYQKMIAGLLATPVPQNAVSIHLAMLNALSETIASDQQLETLFTDPALSLIGIQHYEQSAGDIVTAFTNLDQYFQSNGITFSQSDPGSFLANLIIQ